MHSQLQDKFVDKKSKKKEIMINDKRNFTSTGMWFRNLLPNWDYKFIPTVQYFEQITSTIILSWAKTYK